VSLAQATFALITTLCPFLTNRPIPPKGHGGLQELGGATSLGNDHIRLFSGMGKRSVRGKYFREKRESRRDSRSLDELPSCYFLLGNLSI